MIRTLCALLFASALSPLTLGQALAEDDSLVRLPGSGEVKSERDKSRLNSERLKPGGGLLASFDVNADGRISDVEMQAGIERAFLEADENGDGTVTAIEQQKWADKLPTRDNSLANPVRFDPNLDRRVSFREFSSVIIALSEDYREDGQAELRVASLRAKDGDRPGHYEDRREDALEDVMRRPDERGNRTAEW